MKTSLVVAISLLVLSAAFWYGNAEGEVDIEVGLGRELKRRRRKGPKPSNVGVFENNHPVCAQIYNSWWNNRLSQETLDAFTTFDTNCEVYNDDPIECNKHIDCNYQGTLPGGVCQGNPCQYYNTGHCTLQETGGKCVWWTSSQVKKLNKYYKANGLEHMVLKGHGCYRNPCDSQGRRNDPIRDCNNGVDWFEVPGIYKCTWCEGNYMGCQMTVPTTKGQCAPVKSKDSFVQNNVVKTNKGKKCECGLTFPLCRDDFNGVGVSSGSESFSAKHGNDKCTLCSGDSS